MIEPFVPLDEFEQDQKYPHKSARRVREEPKLGFAGVRHTLNTVLSTDGEIIPFDDTVPLITEGTEVFSVVYQPTLTSKDLCIDAYLPGVGAGSYTRIAAIFVGNVCVGSGYLLGNSGVVIPLQAHGLFQLVDVNELVISVRVGSSSADDFFINGGNSTGDRKLGGSQKATLTIREATRVS